MENESNEVASLKTKSTFYALIRLTKAQRAPLGHDEAKESKRAYTLLVLEPFSKLAYGLVGSKMPA